MSELVCLLANTWAHRPKLRRSSPWNVLPLHDAKDPAACLKLLEWLAEHLSS